MDEFVAPAPVDEQAAKKKRSRSTKKSLVAQNEKRLKFLNTLLESDHLPKYVLEVLKAEESEKGHILKLDWDSSERLLIQLQDFLELSVKELLDPDTIDERADTVGDVILAVVGLLQYMTMFHDAKESASFTHMAIMLNVIMTQQSACHWELRNEICKLSEYCCIRELRVGGEFYLDTVNFLLDLTLDKNADHDLKPDVKRMWEMHVAMTRMNLRTQSCEVVVNKLERVVVSPTYLSCKEGRQFIAFTFTLDTKLIKRFQRAVKNFLPSCKRQQASSYGEVYYCAWVNGSPDVKQIIETQCIQNLMSHMFVFPRKKQELNNLGHNVFAVLSYLHHNRSNTAFSKVLTGLYMPLLWRHLRSGNNIERCNAAEVFLDVYPLEPRGSGMVEKSEFLNKQHGEMVDLLTDNCHVVRIIAIKGICLKLCSAWDTFPQESIQVLMRNLVALANDGSMATVRRALYEGLSVMLCKAEPAAYLARVLPGLQEYLHDESEKVRRAFVKLLIAVKSLSDREDIPAPIKYWKIVTVNSLAARLETENEEVGKALSKLLMSNIYSAETPIDKVLFRLMKFIEISPMAARKLFKYSKKTSLEYKDAVRVMLTILVNLRAYVKRREESFLAKEPEEKVEELPPTLMHKRKKRRSNLEMSTISETEENKPDTEEDKENTSSNGVSNSSVISTSSKASASTSRIEEDQQPDEYSKPGVMHALVDIVSLLWSLHSDDLSKAENEVDHNNLIDLTCHCVPLFLKYFKGSPTYYAVVHLSSLVPANKLMPVSTVCSACASYLKQFSEVTPQGEIGVIIHALCSWNRFDAVQDLVLDWLDQAFRCEGLNQSQAPGEEYNKQRKVRFVAKGAKPMLALRLLDAVFEHPVNSSRVMKKSYNLVYDLYVFMHRIKTLVERRVTFGLPLDSPMLSDVFLQKCLMRYMKLILLLHRLDPPSSRNNETVLPAFDASPVFKEFVQWTIQTVKPMIPQRLEEEPDFCVLVLKDILQISANLFHLRYANDNTIIKVGELIQGLMKSDVSLWFVEYSMIVTKHLKDLSLYKYGREDDKSVMSTVVPSLLSHVLKSLSTHKYTKEEICDCVQNLTEMKTCMYEVVYALLQLFSEESTLLRSVLKLFTDALVAVIVHDVRQLQLLDVVDKVQELPFVCGVLLSVLTRPTLIRLWLSTVPLSIAETYSRDSNLLAASVSLLHTLAHSRLVLGEAELTAALKEAYCRVSQFTRESTQLTADVTDATDSTWSTEYIDVKSVALPVLSELATFLNCPLR